MNNKNIGVITLCGLIIGSVLGSGIVLLPPLAYKMIGEWSILAWIFIMLLGVVFAYVFIFLSLKSPGNEGVAIAVGNTLGNFWRELTSNFLSTAVCFGPTAILITASEFLKNFSFLSNINVMMLAFGLEIVCVSILTSGVKTLARITLILTGFTAVLLTLGSVYTLLFSSNIHFSGNQFSLSSFTHTLLLLFWAIIGWEVVGNYIEDIKDPEKTLKKAMTISIIVIVFLYLIVALSLQNISSKEYTITAIMAPLFGSLAAPLISVIASCLCICTYLMVVGGVSRMNASRATKNKLPGFLACLNKSGSPINVIMSYFTIHCFILLLAYLKILNLDEIVTAANVFFLSNALIGLFTGFKLLKNIKLRIAIIILIASFIFLLFRASVWSLSLLIMIFVLTLYYQFDVLNKHLTKAD